MAVSKTQSIIASNAVAASSGRRAARRSRPSVRCFGKAGIAFVSRSATLPALATSGKNPTFFRVVPDDDVQGPQDANYIVNHLHPKAVLIIDDDEAYSQGLVNVMIPILQEGGDHGQPPDAQRHGHRRDARRALKSLVTSQLTSDETVTVLPWQTATNAQQFGLDAKQAAQDHDPVRHRRHELAVAVQDPRQLRVGVRRRTSRTSTSALDKSIVAGVAKYGPYGPFGVPTYEAADVVMKAIASVCKAGQTPSRSNVLAAIKTTNIPPSRTSLGHPDRVHRRPATWRATTATCSTSTAQGTYVEITA